MNFAPFKPAALAATAALLAACQAPPPGPEILPPPRIADVAHKCNANDSRFALGQTMTPELLEEARDRTVARTAVTVKSGEIPSPADPLRLIIEVDAQGKMVGARCG